MEGFLGVVKTVNDAVNGVVWGWPALILLAFVGVLMTVLTKVFQVSHIGHWMKNTLGAIFKDKSVTGHTEDKSISQFQSLCTALAATVGTGNIVGVCGAIMVGGPGAVFWMWPVAFFGMMTNYSENVLGIFYRRKNKNDEWSGGAMYYLKDGLGSKKGCKWIGIVLAVLFSLFCILASFGIGNMTQVNSISGNMNSVFGIPTWITGIVILFIAGLVIVGGLKRIASVTEKIVPFMVVIYIVGAIVIACFNITSIPAIFKAIFRGAFSMSAVGGGIVGGGIKIAMEQGMKRGVFSNEAGLGSSVMVHSNSNAKEPVRQGMWGIFEVFADTIIVCSLTAIVILSSGLINLNNGQAATYQDANKVSYYNYTVATMENNKETALDWVVVGDSEDGPYFSNEAGETISLYATENKDTADGIFTSDEIVFATKTVEVDGEDKIVTLDAKTGEETTEYDASKMTTLTKANAMSTVFSNHFGKVGGGFIAIAIALFAFSTVLGWSHYGKKAFEYLFGTKATIGYSIVFVLAIFGGAVMGDNLAWDLSDTFNGLMMIPNLIGVLVLSPLVVKITKNYVQRKLKKEDVEPILSYDPEIQAKHAEEVKKGAE